MDNEIESNDISGFPRSYFDEESNNLENISFSSISFNPTYYLCKTCFSFPKIEFYGKNIKLICSLEPKPFGNQIYIEELIKYAISPYPNPEIYLSPHVQDINYISLDDIQNHFVNDGLYNDTAYFQLLCLTHKYKYSHFCFKCKKNLCKYCLESNYIRCYYHKEEIKDFNIDYLKATEKISKIEELEIYKYFSKGHYCLDDSKCSLESSSDIETIKLVQKEGNNNILEKIILIKDKENIIDKDLLKILSKIGILDEEDDGEYILEKYFKLFSTVFDNFRNHPNYNHIVNINNIEKFLREVWNY